MLFAFSVRRPNAIFSRFVHGSEESYHHRGIGIEDVCDDRMADRLYPRATRDHQCRSETSESFDIEPDVRFAESRTRSVDGAAGIGWDHARGIRETQEVRARSPARDSRCKVRRT